MAKQKVSVSWSGGKDSAMALYKILKSDQFKVISLHTAFDQKLKRVGMHGISEALIMQQAASIGLTLEKIYLPEDSTHGSYEKVMADFCQQQKTKGVEALIYGDILLQDLKAYREEQLEKAGLKAIFPLWASSTSALVEEFIDLDFKTLICCLNAQKLPKAMLGKTMDKVLVKEIAKTADPCGENGEFHTFVFEGPIFKGPLSFKLGDAVLESYQFKVEKEGKLVEGKADYWFQEILSGKER